MPRLNCAYYYILAPIVTKVSPLGDDQTFMRERRSEVRMLCADVIEVSWKEGGKHLSRAIGLLEDISQSGACLQMEAPIPVGSVIEWESPFQKFTGSVCYCSYREIGYFVGVEFAAGTQWSEDIFLPQHLLDVRRMTKEQAEECEIPVGQIIPV